VSSYSAGRVHPAVAWTLDSVVLVVSGATIARPQVLTAGERQVFAQTYLLARWVCARL
jgi:hypothetical protein